MLDKNVTTTASNIIYSTFLAIICSNFYIATQGNTFGFSKPVLQLPLLNQVLLICVIIYLVMNWLADTVYHASPLLISDFYMLGSLLRIILFGFCFYESFNPGGFKFWLFFCAGSLEVLLEYFAYRSWVLPVVQKAEEKALAKPDDSSIYKFAFAAAKVVPILLFFLRFSALLGMLIFSYKLPNSTSVSSQSGQAIAVGCCLGIFTLLKIFTWLIIRQQEIIGLFQQEEAIS